jgi:putative alpha-1,2-mannosidase
MAFTLLPVFGGEGKAPPMNKEKSLLIDYVDPFIGTTNFGTTNPGAVCPNGMMSVVPFNVMGSADNTIKMHVGGPRLMNIPIVSLQDILM